MRLFTAVDYISSLIRRQGCQYWLMFTFVAELLLVWSYYPPPRHFRPWPAVMEKLCDELKAWSDCLGVPVAWLSMAWVCRGQVSLTARWQQKHLIFFFSPSTSYFWVVECKGVVHNCKTVWISCDWNLHWIGFDIAFSWESKQAG